MAQLNIENATVGYSTVGLQDYINKINIEVVDKIIETINKTIPQLRETTDTVWVGQSADAFKQRLEDDSKTVIETLNSIKEMVEGQMAQIAQNVDNYDADAAEGIKNF